MYDYGMTTCSIADCSKPVVARQMCGAHYKLWQKYGDPTVGTARWDGHVKVDKTCAVDGCGKPSRKANYCPMHSKRLRLYGDLDYVGRRGGENRSTPETFWAKFGAARGADECWEFPGSRTSWGYGSVRYRGKWWQAHRLAFALTHGRMPEQMVLHRCDNPPCCNPAHLYEGDGSQNMNDMYSRGRGNRPTGDDHPMAKRAAAARCAMTANQ